MSNNFSSDLSAVLAALRLCFDGMRFVSFTYDSSFILEFQRDGPQSTAGLPVVSRLILRGAFQIESGLKIPSDQAANTPSELAAIQPSQAFHMMALVNQQVRDTAIADGRLSVLFNNGGCIDAIGREAEWDFAWHAGVRSNQPTNEEDLSIECDPEGEVYCSWAARFDHFFGGATANRGCE